MICSYEEVMNFILNSKNHVIIYGILITIILIYNLIEIRVYLKRINHYNSFSDPEEINLQELKYHPQVNIIIPAWKEGEIFKNLLESIKQLKYPNIKAIVNAGGNKETLNIVEPFRNLNRFVILHQKKGSERPSLGKVDAINKALKHVIEGIIYFIDADSFLTDEILMRMIFPIINLNQDVVIGGVRPLKEQDNLPLVKYLLFERFKTLDRKFNRIFRNNIITGQNLCISYRVLSSIHKFTIQDLIPTDESMGRDIFSKGFNAYRLVNYRHRIYVDYSSSLKEYFHQRLIWRENYLYKSLSKNRIVNLFKFIALWLISFYIIVFIFLSFLNPIFLYLGLLILFSLYLKKLRKLYIFMKTVKKEYYSTYKLRFFFYLIFFIWFDSVINSFVLFHFILFKIRLKNSVKN